MKKKLVCLTLLTSMVFGLGLISNKPISEGASDLMYNSKGISLRTRNILRANPEGEVRTNEASLIASKLGVQVGTTSDGKKAMRFVVATSSNDVTVTFNRTLTLESGTVSEKLFTAATYYDAVQISGENTLTPDAWNNQYENADYKYFYCYTMKGITQDYASLGVVATVTDNNDETNTHSSYNIANIAGYNGSVDESFSGIKLDSNKEGSVVINGVTYTYNKTTDKINAFTSISSNPETLEVLEGNLVRKVEVVYKQITVNDAEIVNVDGKAILNLKGTYSDNATAEEVLALKPVFNLQQNQQAGASGWEKVIDDKASEKCTLTASNGNWVCSYDLSEINVDYYLIHFSLEGRLNPEGHNNAFDPVDCKPTVDVTKNDVLIGNKSYKVLNYPGATSGAKYWGGIGVVVSDASKINYEYTKGEVKNVDGNARLVFSGTSTYGSLERLNASTTSMALQHNYNIDKQSWDHVEYTTSVGRTYDESNGNWTVSFDINDLAPGAYTVKFNMDKDYADFRIGEACNYTVNVGPKTYQVVRYPGSNEGTEFWGCLGIIVSDSLEYTTPDIEVIGDKVLYVIKGPLSGEATVESLTSFIENNRFIDFQRNPYMVTGAWDGDGNDWSRKTPTLDHVSIDTENNEYKAYYDITSIPSYKYTGHYGRVEKADFKPANAIDKTVTLNNRSYQIVVVPNGGDSNYWGNVGLIIEDLDYDVAITKGETVRFEAENATNSTSKAWVPSGFSGFTSEDASASGGAFVTSSTGNPSNAGTFSFKIYVPEDGEVTLVGAYSQSEAKKTSDMPMDKTYTIKAGSVEFTMTSEDKTLAAIDSAYNWRTFTYTASLTKGVHTITVSVVNNTGKGCPCIDYFELSM